MRRVRRGAREPAVARPQDGCAAAAARLRQRANRPRHPELAPIRPCHLAAGSYGHPPAVYVGCDDAHKAHSPSSAPAHQPHLPTGSAVNAAARPVSPTDDASGSYGHPPSVYVGCDDTHKAHRP